MENKIKKCFSKKSLFGNFSAIRVIFLLLRWSTTRLAHILILHILPQTLK